MSTYDVIVLGTGGVGSAATFHLAKRGARVLGLDRFPAGHDRGSSHGHTRIIRKAYFEHPDYVPLLHRAYELWKELEAQRGETLYSPAGLIEIGPPEGIVIPGVLRAAEQHGLAVDRVSRAELSERFPGFVMDPDHVAVYEQDAGYLFVEACVQAHAAEARRLGAELRDDAEIISWQVDGDSVSVKTTVGIYEAGALVVTAGAWAGTLLADLNIPFRVLRKHLHWFATESRHYDADAACPVFFYEANGGYYYGFPAIDERGLKVAEHHGGTEVRDPLEDSRTLEESVAQRVDLFLSQYLPGVSQRCTGHAVCFYTVSPDEHFVVDRHPTYSQVVFAAGLSGHGFKFTTVFGEILADLATSGRTPQPIEFLNCRRPALRPG